MKPNLLRLLPALATTLVVAPPSQAQSQSLAFTGGVLLNPRINFRNLGAIPPSAAAGPATGSAVNRTYDNGFNRVDASGNREQATANWGYQDGTQLVGDTLALSADGGSAAAEIEDAGDFLNPSGNLEYRGSLGPVGSSDWGILLGIGYQTVGASESRTLTTDTWLQRDAYSLNGLTATDLPAAPYAGSADLKTPRIGSVPARTLSAVTGGRLLTGHWELEAEMIPFTGGVYLESQILGRLNTVISAGILAVIINADLKYEEQSTVGNAATVVSRGSDGTNDFVFGGFVQAGLDWALWEDASLVASARWQPTEHFSHSSAGREAEIDSTLAFSVHAGFSMRF